MSDARAEELIAALAPLDSVEVVDLGCGWAELLLRLLEAEPSTTGIDTTDEELPRGRRNAEARGLAERVRLAQGDAGGWDGTADVAISIGSSHAWGGTRQALEAIRPRLPRGGRLLLGEAFRDTASMRNDLDVELSLAELVELTEECGFRMLRLATAGTDEWDSFESRWCGALEKWLLDNPTAAGHDEVRALADEHRTR
ncbi:class I SAM-dependent methyltransferase [Saccharopolyspora elongata]|uniref:Class I SAM-dependent methyltransferase n=2 Tax=Saccharopolyspora elongata TaxID=2530387 RepID=A0A4R4Z0F7_9PSEU|nr:class I SAM-dependent methyltransferase [Saccharopolyspora elongata]